MPESVQFSGLPAPNPMLDCGNNNLQGSQLERSKARIVPHPVPYPRPARRRALRLAQTGIAAFALLPLAAGAVGFGKARVLSRVGQPLNVDIPLLGQLTGDQGDAACFRVAVPPHAGGDDLPWLSRARVEILGDVAPYLRITTTQAIPHPILMLGVRAGCGMELGREFTLLLEAPPDDTAAPAAPANPALTGADERPLAGPAPRAQGSATPPPAAPVDAALAKLAPAAPTARPQTTATARKPKRAKTPAPTAPAAEPPAAAPRAGDHLSVSGGSGYADGGDGGLRMATTLDSLAGGPTISERERALLRQEQRLLAALDEQTSTQMLIEDKIRALEATLADLHREAQPPRPAAPLVVPAAAPAPAPVARTEAGWGTWLAAALAGLVVVGLAGMRRRHRAAPALPEVAAHPAQEEAPAPAEEEPPADPAQDLDLTQLLPTDKVTPLLERTIVLSKPPLGEPPVAANDGASSEVEQDSVVELADIMLSFGRSLGAAQALSDFIAAHPKQGVKPWIKLLEVYRHAGMRAEFEELAPRLNRTFNVRVPAWDAFDAAHGTDTLENYPHIMTRLNVGWDDPDALDYLQSLLRDNRDGQRLGFPLPVIGEILLLIAIQRERQSTTADASASDEDNEGGLRLVVN